jgi:hypothetical protein
MTLEQALKLPWQQRLELYKRPEYRQLAIQDLLRTKQVAESRAKAGLDISAQKQYADQIRKAAQLPAEKFGPQVSTAKVKQELKKLTAKKPVTPTVTPVTAKKPVTVKKIVSPKPEKPKQKIVVRRPTTPVSPKVTPAVKKPTTTVPKVVKATVRPTVKPVKKQPVKTTPKVAPKKTTVAKATRTVAKPTRKASRGR